MKSQYKLKHIALFESYLSNPYEVYNTPEFIKFINEEFYKEGSSFICTYVASLVRMLEAGKTKLYGFSEVSNPTALLFQLNPDDPDEDEGHQFAVVEDRYIIDPWVYDNYNSEDEEFRQSVFDLQNPADAENIVYAYGDRNCWTELHRVDPFEMDFPGIADSVKRYMDEHRSS